MTRALRVLAVVLCAGVIGAACSSNRGTHTTAPTTTHHHSATTTTSSNVPTTASTTSTTSTTGIGPCAQVSASQPTTQGAAGTIVGMITLTEVGTGTCTIDGYPTLTRFNASGTAVQTTMVHGLTINVSGPPSQPPAVVTLTPTQQAEFTFQYSDVVTGTETSCATSTTLSITTPGATSASTPLALPINACNSGTVDVSAIYAATAS